MVLAWTARPTPFLLTRLVAFVWWFIFVVFGFEISIFLSACFDLTFQIMKSSVALVMDLFV